MLPREKAKITTNGLIFKKLPYSNEDVRTSEGWFAKARAKGQREIFVHYDPAYVNEIYYISPDRAEPLSFKMLDSHLQVYGNLSFDETNAEIKRRNRLLKTQQKIADADKTLGTSYRNNIVESSTKKTNKSLKLYKSIISIVKIILYTKTMKHSVMQKEKV